MIRDLSQLCPQVDRKGYRVADVVVATGFSTRRVQRLFAKFRAQGYPLVYDEPTSKGVTRAVVDAAEYDALGRGEITQEALPAS